MEYSDHLEGMLDRDQRTAKLRYFISDKEVPKTYSFHEKRLTEIIPKHNSIISHHSYCPTRTKKSNSLYLTWRNGYLLHNFKSLKNVLIVGIYLTLVTLPLTNSAPTNVKMSSRLKETGKWINPCGIQDNAKSEPTGLREIVSVSDWSTHIIYQATIALNKASEFKDRYAQKTFQKNFDDVHTIFKEQNYDWLVKLPKTLGEEIPEDHLKFLKFDETLLNVYGYLQSIAVGLEQVVWDQQDQQGFFAGNFGETEQQLKNVLCELQMALIDHGVTMRPDVTRDIMTDEFRKMDFTGMATRDWIIFREYMNTLEYIIKAFSYIKKTV